MDLFNSRIHYKWYNVLYLYFICTRIVNMYEFEEKKEIEVKL